MDELLYLYIHGIEVTDPITGEAFTLRAAMLRLVADYRALPKLLLMMQVGWCCCGCQRCCGRCC